MTKTTLNPYLSFKANTRDAMEFYKGVFGGTLELTTFKESGVSRDPSEDDLVMHAILTGENSLTFMASDTPSRMTYEAGTNFSMSLNGDNEEELTTYFNNLAEGGTITEPLVEAPWGDTFGMLTDKFGIQWMVNITKSQS